MTETKPLVVALAGTLGLKIVLKAFRQAPWRTVGIVSPANAGASFAQLHSEIGASADEVLIPTLDRVEVAANLSDGTQLIGETEIAQGRPGVAIERVALFSNGVGLGPGDFRPSPEALEALKQAEAIIIGPGSLFTNLIPLLLIKELNSAIRQSTARKVFVCNLMTQPNQTEGFSLSDHVRALQRHTGIKIDYVLAHHMGHISDQVLARYRSTSAELVASQLVINDGSQIAVFPDTAQEMVLIEGAILVQRELAIEVIEPDPETGLDHVVVRHDPERLQQALRTLLSDLALQKQLAVSRAIFREYDIRGLVGAELNNTAMETLGRAFGTYIQRRTGRNQVVMGRDARPSSAGFAEAAIRGLVSTGCEVIDIGQVPTPLTSFAIGHFWVDGVAQVTASHNPAEFNGVKLQIGLEPLAGEELQKVERLIASNAFAVGSGRHLVRDVVYPYLNCITHRISLDRPLRVAVDAGNGVSGPLALRMLRELGCEVHALYCTPDGTFPNHPPDPSEEANLSELCQLVQSEDCDLGIALDGDGDRIGVIDEQGHIVPPDHYLLLFAREALRNGPGKIVFEVRCSEMLFDGVRKFGGIPVMSRCGNTSILPRMRQERALLGGELSGHVFFSDPPFEFDDALYAAALLLSYIDRERRPLSQIVSELLQGLPRYVSSPELRIDCPDYLKDEIVDKVRETLAKRYRVIDIDGARAYFDEGNWALIRASNTSPKLSLRFEGLDRAALVGMQNEMWQLLHPHLPDLLPFGD